MATRIFTLLAAMTLAACTGSNQPASNSELVSSDTKPNTPTVSGKFVPPSGKSIMFVGQDSETISDYIRDVPEDNLEGVTLYTMLKSPDPEQTLSGVFSLGNWNSGDVDFAQTLSQAPNAALAIGLAFDACNDVDHATKIANGEYDESIKTFAGYLASLAPRKVFLRIGYEFDGMWNCYNPESYKLAYRVIAEGVRDIAPDNVTMVWQSATWPAPEFAGVRAHLYDHNDPEHINKWYPGDDVVDWVSISVFYRDLSQFNFYVSITPADAQQKFLDFARAKGKPIFISESAPQGYRIGLETHSFIGLNAQTPRSAEAIWRDWYQPYFDFIYDNQDVIRGVAYINTHWEAQSRWYCAPNATAGTTQCPEGNWGDSRVQANDYIKAQWLKRVNDGVKWTQNSDY